MSLASSRRPNLSPSFIAEQWPILCTYLGDVAFARLVSSHTIANNAHSKSQAWLSNNLLQFLRSYGPVAHRPEIFELANFEAAFRNAFESTDQSNARKSDLQFHPSAQLLQFHHNTTSIWAALTCGEQAPRPHGLDQPQNVLVWRQGLNCRFRLLGPDEAAACNLMIKGTTHKALAAVFKATHQDANRAASDYLFTWVGAKLLPANTDALEK